MKRLRRDSLYTEGASHEKRIQALERRFLNDGHAWAFVRRDTDQSVASNGAYSIQWEDFLTNAPGSFWTNTDNSMTKHNTSGDTSLVCAEYGVYIAVAISEWEQSLTGYARRQIFSAGRQRGVTTGGFGLATVNSADYTYAPASGATIPDVSDTSIGIHEWWDYTTIQPANWSMQAVNDDTGARNLLRAMITVVLLPNGQREQDFTVY